MIFHVQDMVAFSCCIFDGGVKEKEDMDAARERGWKGKFTKRGKVIRPGAIRLNGKMPSYSFGGNMIISLGLNLRRHCSDIQLPINRTQAHKAIE